MFLLNSFLCVCLIFSITTTFLLTYYNYYIREHGHFSHTLPVSRYYYFLYSMFLYFPSSPPISVKRDDDFICLYIIKCRFLRANILYLHVRIKQCENNDNLFLYFFFFSFVQSFAGKKKKKNQFLFTLLYNMCHIVTCLRTLFFFFFTLVGTRTI